MIEITNSLPKVILLFLLQTIAISLLFISKALDFVNLEGPHGQPTLQRDIQIPIAKVDETIHYIISPAGTQLQDISQQISNKRKELGLPKKIPHNKREAFFRTYPWIMIQDFDIKSPIPGSIVEIYVKTGQIVQEGDILFTIEMMKMYIDVRSPFSGKVMKILRTRKTEIEEECSILKLVPLSPDWKAIDQNNILIHRKLLKACFPLAKRVLIDIEVNNDIPYNAHLLNPVDINGIVNIVPNDEADQENQAPKYPPLALPSSRRSSLSHLLRPIAEEGTLLGILVHLSIPSFIPVLTSKTDNSPPSNPPPNRGESLNTYPTQPIQMDTNRTNRTPLDASVPLYGKETAVLESRGEDHVHKLHRTPISTRAMMTLREKFKEKQAYASPYSSHLWIHLVLGFLAFGSIVLTVRIQNSSKFRHQYARKIGPLIFYLSSPGNLGARNLNRKSLFKVYRASIFV